MKKTLACRFELIADIKRYFRCKLILHRAKCSTVNDLYKKYQEQDKLIKSLQTLKNK